MKGIIEKAFIQAIEDTLEKTPHVVIISFYAVISLALILSLEMIPKERLLL